LAAALHNVNGLYVGADSTGPSAGSEIGWAVAGGLKINLPWARGDEFWVQGTWARGATNYLGFNPFVHTAGQWATYGGARVAGAGACPVGGAATCGTFAGAWMLDGLYGGPAGTGGIALTEGWSILAAIQHYWTPSLRTSVFGHYTSLNFGANATAKFCGGFIPGVAANMVVGLPAGCNPDFDIMQVGTRTVWSPVRNLDIGVEVLYTKIDQSFVGTWNLPAQGGRQAGLYTAADHDVWSGTVRFQRNFWP
jgi:hypothetical protein